MCQFVHVLAGALGLGPTLAAVDLSDLDWDDDEEEKGGDMVARAASGSSELVVAPRAGISRSHLEPAAESAALGKAAELCELFATVDAAGSGRVDWETFSSFMVPRPPPARWLPLPRPVLQRSSPYPFLLTPPPPHLFRTRRGRQEGSVGWEPLLVPGYVWITICSRESIVCRTGAGAGAHAGAALAGGVAGDARAAGRGTG